MLSFNLRAKSSLRILGVLLPFVMSSSAVACPSLIGEWQSSKPMSMAFNQKSKTLSDTQLSFLSQTLGELKLTYTRSEMLSHGISHREISVSGKSYDFSFDPETYEYEVIACKDNRLTITESHSGGVQESVTLHFVNDNVYWLNPKVLPASREYFVRITE